MKIKFGGKDKVFLYEDSTKGDWSSGMIPVLGTGGPGFNSRIAPFLFPSINLFYTIKIKTFTKHKLIQNRLNIRQFFNNILC